MRRGEKEEKKVSKRRGEGIEGKICSVSSRLLFFFFFFFKLFPFLPSSFLAIPFWSYAACGRRHTDQKVPAHRASMHQFLAARGVVIGPPTDTSARCGHG